MTESLACPTGDEVSPRSYTSLSSSQKNLTSDVTPHNHAQETERNPSTFAFGNDDCGLVEVASHKSEDYRLQLLGPVTESSEEKELAAAEAISKSERGANRGTHFPENSLQTLKAYHSMPRIDNEANSPNRFIAFKYSSTTSRKKHRVETSKTNKTN